jgi:glycosyltransferase involved in cell wall biosynthesis
MRSDKMLKVLVAPAEFYFTASNYYVSYNLPKRIKAKFYIFANKIGEEAKQDLDNAELYELNTSLLLYPLKVLFYARKLIKEVDLIHHLSPFAIGKDFNLLALSNIKSFVIGPVEVPHKFFEDELKIMKIPSFVELIKNSKLRQILSIKNLERCDIAIAVNNQTKKYLSRFISVKKIKIIPLGVDLDLFKYSPPPQNHDILAVGMHIKRKGFNYLIEAMQNILEEYSDAKLHITSDGPQTYNLKMLVKRLNLNNNVTFHGRVSNEEILQLYKQCRVFCHPSLSEGFCHTTLEAMATGRPVVSTNTIGSEMVEDGKTGFLVPIADSDAIADAILKVFSDEELTYRMGVEGRKKVEEKYDWDIIAKKYYEVYKGVTI